MRMPLPDAIIAIWAPFAVLFTQPVWLRLQPTLAVLALLVAVPPFMARALALPK